MPRERTRRFASHGQSVVLDQCRTHMSPKLSPPARSTALAYGRSLDPSLAPKRQNEPAMRRASHNLRRQRDRSSVSGATIALTRQASIAHANSSSTMSMNLCPKTEEKEHPFSRF